MRELEAIASTVIGEAIAIHRELGPGLLESVYETVLAAALLRRGYRVERQVPVSIEYDGMSITGAFRVDLLVEGCLVLEIKAVINWLRFMPSNCSPT